MWRDGPTRVDKAAKIKGTCPGICTRQQRAPTVWARVWQESRRSPSCICGETPRLLYVYGVRRGWLARRVLRVVPLMKMRGDVASSMSSFEARGDFFPSPYEPGGTSFRGFAKILAAAPPPCLIVRPRSEALHRIYGLHPSHPFFRMILLFERRSQPLTH